MRTQIHLLGAFWLCPLIVAGLAPCPALAQEIATVSNSTLAAIKLPGGAAQINGDSVPKEINDALHTLIQSGGPRIRQGQCEVLAWTGQGFGKSRVATIKANLARNLKNAGWTTEEKQIDDKDGVMTLLTAQQSVPRKRALLGLWLASNEALVLAWTEMLPASASEITSSSETSQPTDAPATAGTTTLQLQGLQRQINVMKGAEPPKPTFAPLEPKPGFVRGWVKDWTGKPLQGAVIGVRSTAAGGFYSGAQAKTDARGYYEIQVPWGVASFYCAGYTLDWGDDGRAALGLGAADGQTDGFASAQGAVKNWVLWPYGIADRDGMSEQPQFPGNYFGGSFSVSTSVGDDPNSTTDLPVGATVELSLSPMGTLFDGSKGKSFTLRRPLEYAGSLFYVNNIPLGQYKISARLLQNGQSKPLQIKETGPYANQPFGLEPKETRGEATLTFRPDGAKAETATANHGNWGSLNITLYP